MNISHFTIILLLEGLLVAILGLMMLWRQRGENLKTINDLQEKLDKTNGDTPEENNDTPPPSAPPEPEIRVREKSYIEHIQEQLDATVSFYKAQTNETDIEKDLESDVPDSRKVAAIRHAILISEKEASALDPEDIEWEYLLYQYQQIVKLLHKPAAEEAPKEQPKMEVVKDAGNKTEPDGLAELEEELKDAQEHLDCARKRISNLEKFKALYFELEAKWNETKDIAQIHFDELKDLASQTENTEDWESLLDNYNDAYQDVDSIIVNPEATEEVVIDSEQTLSEIRRLRTMTNEQHFIIEELRNKLESERNDDDKLHMISNMQVELEKQARFLHESETCIKLLEEELKTAKAQTEAYKHKSKRLSQLSTKIKDLEYSETKNQHVMQAQKEEIRRLNEKVNNAESKASSANELAQRANIDKLERSTKDAMKSLKDMEAKYADLEERYINLKLQG